MTTKTPKAQPYPGPFATPPPESLKGAIGWRHKSEHYSPTRWRPAGFVIVFPDGIEEIDLDGNRIRSSALWAP